MHLVLDLVVVSSCTSATPVGLLYTTAVCSMSSMLCSTGPWCAAHCTSDYWDTILTASAMLLSTTLSSDLLYMDTSSTTYSSASMR